MRSFPLKNWINLPEEKTPMERASIRDLEQRLANFVIEAEAGIRKFTKTIGERNSLTENKDGDLVFVEETSQIYEWNNTAKEWKEVAAAHWKAPVAKKSELPTEGNGDGDVRYDKETKKFYIWNNTAKEWNIPVYKATTNESHTWAIAERVKEGVIPGPYFRVEEHEEQILSEFEAELGAGEAKFKFLYNGAAQKFEGGGTEVEVKHTAVSTYKLETPISFKSKDRIALECTSSTASTGLAFSAFIKHITTVT